MEKPVQGLYTSDYPFMTASRVKELWLQDYEAMALLEKNDPRCSDGASRLAIAFKGQLCSAAKARPFRISG